MNVELITAFLVIAMVLIVAPGPIVTLVVSAGVTQGPRAAPATIAGATLGNAVLLAAIALGLGWVHAHADLLFNALSRGPRRSAGVGGCRSPGARADRPRWAHGSE